MTAARGLREGVWSFDAGPSPGVPAEGAATSVGDLLAALGAAGLDDDDAEAYLTLVRAGRAGASEFAEAAGVSRPTAYRVLDGLVRLNLATVALARPRTYVPTPPEEVFDRLEARERARVRAVQAARDHAVGPLTRLMKGGMAPPSAPEWRLIRGRPAVVDALRVLVEGADREILFLSGHQAAVGGAFRVRDVWALAMERLAEGAVGVRAVLGSGLEPPIPSRGDALRSAVRHHAVDGMATFMVADGARVLSLVAADSSVRYSAEGDVAFWSDAGAVVALHRMLFDLAWGAAAGGA